MCGLSYTPSSRWWYGKKSVFWKYLSLNSKFSVLNKFPWMGSRFPTEWKKINQKAQGKKVSGGEGAYVPPHLVVKLESRCCLHLQKPKYTAIATKKWLSAKTLMTSICRAHGNGKAQKRECRHFQNPKTKHIYHRVSFLTWDNGLGTSFGFPGQNFVPSLDIG